MIAMETGGVVGNLSFIDDHREALGTVYPLPGDGGATKSESKRKRDVIPRGRQFPFLREGISC